MMLPKQSVVIAMWASAFAVPAHAASTYILTITNGGTMPLSPGVAYAKQGQLGKAEISKPATQGFVQLCQTGNPSRRLEELRADNTVSSVAQVGTGPLLPGQSVTVEVTVADVNQQSIQFETMYGMTKDLCASGAVGSHALVALKQHVTTDFVGRDSVLQTGAFLDPVVPTDSHHGQEACADQESAIACLRELSMTNTMEQGKVRHFVGYLPSLVTFLEKKYGASAVLPLLVPTSGAVQFTAKLKH